ncbi:hypothetical protein HYT57_02010 [Candidatus Woesearchaeota archaeon]|nr:hypothetical protein [Candidatus Woesearchaeota archaeon]
MKFQLGRKKVEEIEELIDTNCWKAFVWIHVLLQQQLYHIYFFGIQKKPLGYVKHSETKKNYSYGYMGIRKAGKRKTDEFDKKWKLMEKRVARNFLPITHLCYSCSLIDDDTYNSLERYNKFRNSKIGHPTIHEYLASDEEVKESCKNGIALVRKLDKIYEKILTDLPQRK